MISEEKIYSQNGEDGVIQSLMSTLYTNDPSKKFFVEIGVEDGSECNTRNLRENYGWKGLMLDANNENLEINLRKHFVTRDNFTELLKKYSVPKHVNLISIDIDYNDFYILHEFVKHYSADIVVCEYNASHAHNKDCVVEYDETHVWRGSDYFGASLLSYQRMMQQFDYSLVYTEKQGINAFFVHNKALNKAEVKFDNVNDVEKIYHPPNYGKNKNGHRKDKQNRQYTTTKKLLF